MSPGDLLLGAAGAAAVMRLWARHLAAPGSETLVLAAVLPLVVVLGRPWSRGPGVTRAPRGALALALAVGLAADVSVLTAVGGVGLLADALARAGLRSAHPRPAALAVLGVAGCPWIGGDLDAVADLFRWTEASAVAALARACGIAATAAGPRIDAPGLTVLVDASCAGMATLQACVLVAAVVQVLPGDRGRGLTARVAEVVAVAWGANVLRLAALVAIALALGPDAARGPAHEAVGLASMALPALALARGPADRGAA